MLKGATLRGMDSSTAQSAQLKNSPVVLVTGGAKRIGKAISLAFAKAGWRVAIHFNSSQTEANETLHELLSCGVDAMMLQADLANETQTRGLIPAVCGRFDRIDAVVNNASRFELDDAASFQYAHLAAHMASNLAAPLVLSQALHDALQPNQEGVVINLLDQKLYNLNPDFLSYTMTKAGLAAATVMLAKALAPRVRVVGVAPGLTLASYLQDESSFARAHQVSVLNRSSDLGDIAATVLFAATNRSITGSTILVDGGQHLLSLPRDISLMP